MVIIILSWGRLWFTSCSQQGVCDSHVTQSNMDVALAMELEGVEIFTISVIIDPCVSLLPHNRSKGGVVKQVNITCSCQPHKHMTNMRPDRTRTDIEARLFQSFYRVCECTV